MYPTELESAPKSAQETKIALKSFLKPTEMGIQVSTLRRVGNAGVIVQTTSKDAVVKIRGVGPPTLRIAEPKSRRPLVLPHNIDGNPGEESIMLYQ